MSAGRRRTSGIPASTPESKFLYLQMISNAPWALEKPLGAFFMRLDAPEKRHTRLTGLMGLTGCMGLMGLMGRTDYARIVKMSE